jgi:CRP/FNR family transcriptional regulator, cyclic AMP receptor protein
MSRYASHTLRRGFHTIRSDGTEVILAVLGPGEGVGEMSLADSLRRSADVTTLEESVLL